MYEKAIVVILKTAIIVCIQLRELTNISIIQFNHFCHFPRSLNKFSQWLTAKTFIEKEKTTILKNSVQAKFTK